MLKCKFAAFITTVAFSISMLFACPAFGGEKQDGGGDNGSKTDKQALPDKDKQDNAAVEKEINDMIKRLKHEDPGARAYAASRLGEIGPKASRAIPDLMNALINDTDDLVTFHAAISISEMGNAAVSCIPVLITEMKKKKGSCQAIMIAFEKMGGLAKGTVNDLIEMLKDKNEPIREHAYITLGSIGKGAPEIIGILAGKLKDEDVQMRAGILRALSIIGENAAGTLPEIMKLVEDDNPKIRAVALNACFNIGKAKPELIKLYKEKLADRDGNVRWTAASAISGIGEPAKECANALLDGLEDNYSHVKADCAEALGNMSSLVPQAIPKLVNLLADGSPYVREAAENALVKFGEAAISDLAEAMKSGDRSKMYYAGKALSRIGEKTIAVLIQLLDDDKPSVRASAVQALEYMGPPARKAVPNLLDMAKEADGQMKMAIIKALGEIAAPEAYSCLAEWTHDEEYNVREEAVHALVHFKTRESVKVVATALKDPEMEVRLAALNSLGYMEDNGAEAIPEIIAMMDAEMFTGGEQRSMIYALENLAEKGVPKLVPFLKDKNLEKAAFALQILGQLGPKAAGALGEVKEMLKHENPGIRIAALAAVQSIDNNGEEVLSLIKQATKDENDGVKSSAAMSLIMATGHAKESIAYVEEMIKTMKDEDEKEVLRIFIDRYCKKR
jgi:HEAT repeat protein